MSVNIETVKDACFGCTACKAICPADAIEMQPDSEGFYMPSVDLGKCVECGLCRRVCPSINRWNEEMNSDHCNAYVFEHPEKALIKKSTSGGAFAYIAEKSKVEKICGCIQDKDLKIKHSIKSLSGLELFQGSKYVQSDLGECFAEIKQILEKGEKLLFSGTSCQVHGLLNYLKVSNTSVSGLITTDIVCHGVPSPKLYSDYLKHYEEKKNCTIKKHSFRNKSCGWGGHLGILNYLQTIFTEDGKIDQRSMEANLWQNVFFTDSCIRNSCYSCPYSTVNKPADITMGDFWGIERVFSKKVFETGCSLVLVRGESFFKFPENAFVHKFRSVEEIRAQQPRLNKPISRPEKREEFWRDYKNKGFEYVSKKYFNYSKKSKFILRIFFLLIDIAKKSENKLISNALNRIANKLARKVFV